MSNPIEPLMADIIARIERGVPPWRQSLVGSAEPGLPLRADGHPFSGTNLWVLSFIGAARGYASPYWLTFNQARKIGAAVRRGEKGTPAILYKTRVTDGGSEIDAGEPAVGDPREGDRVLRYLRGYYVFCADQLDAVPESLLRVPPVDAALRAAARDTVLDAVPAVVEFRSGATPCYVPAVDRIVMPPPEAFRSTDEFKATLAHEQIHWTSAPPRLDRKLGARYGDREYVFEELIAEIGACLLGLCIGLRPQLLDGHAAYLAHWARLLTDRPNALIEASGYAQKAVDHLLAYAPSSRVES